MTWVTIQNIHTQKTQSRVIGEAEQAGSNGASDSHAAALVDCKILVVAQRDEWKDHWVLMEAFCGAALVS